MVTIFIDNKPYEVKEGQNLLHACLSLGFNVPYFCWHPAMHSVGACRQCAVKQFKDENDTHGRIVMACMTPAANGTRISIDDPDARKFRASNIEWLMLNHPHDCPVCDEGGECHLQDMTVLTGHVYRRTRFKKRTYRNQYLGPFVNHEMNRCIQCYRCLRFYRDYAGGRDFNVFAAHDHVYFGRKDDGVLESEFSGNLIEVCPTGVFTDKTLRQHYTRKWDLQTAPSICAHCGVGCNTIPGERYGEIRRVRNRYNSEVNGYFLCDRGRYGYEFVNSDRRIRHPILRPSEKYLKTENRITTKSPTREDVMKYLEGILYFGAKVIGIGSPRASLEANFALRTLVGSENFYPGISEKDLHLITLIIEILENGPARSPSLHDVEIADAILILGEDVTNVAPMLSLALQQSVRQEPVKKLCEKLNIPRWHDYAVRDAVQNKKGPLFIATPAGTRLDDASTQTYRAAPDDIARLGFAVAHALNTKAPEIAGLPEEVQALAVRIAQALTEAERPLVVSGISCGHESVIRAAANVAWATSTAGRPTHLCFTVPECNSLGLGLIGGRSLDSAFKSVKEETADAVIILENDLYQRAEEGAVDEFLKKNRHVIAIDSVLNQTISTAEVALPSGTLVETDGTLVNNEGRAQRFFKVFHSSDGIRESWRWILDMMAVADRPEAKTWKLFENITQAITESIPVFKPISEIAPPAGFRISGTKIPRQPHRYSGRTSMFSDKSVHEPKPPEDSDSPLSFSMEGFEGIPPSSLITRFWAPGWNSVQAVNKFQSEIGGPLNGGDPGRRLIEPINIRDISYFEEIPAAFRSDQDELLILPLYHIFGSEELSILAQGIAELAPQPYLGLNPNDMHYLQINEGAEVEIILNGKLLCLPARQIATLPPGTAGLPCGLPGLSGIMLPANAKRPRLKMSGVTT
jgi:NADH-quinone oxidoreductase subunit G